MEIKRQDQRARVRDAEPLCRRLIIDDAEEFCFHLRVQYHLTAEVFVKGCHSFVDKRQQIIVLLHFLMHQDCYAIFVTYSELSF